jgi:glycerol uptake facilitator-like aquaporin
VVYVASKISGAFAGVAAAHAMFGLPVLQVSARVRPTLGEGLGEFIATFGLVLVILFALRFRVEAIPMAVAAFITSAYWFTSSTSFANPAVTFARAMTDTFAGISPQNVPLFVVGQVLGGAAAALFARWLLSGYLISSADSSGD